MADGKICWGILGAGAIAARFAKSLSHEPGSVLGAISGRSKEKLDAFVAANLTESVACYLSHDALLADINIDAIYLALPHGMHREWAVRALLAGKAVLCEKPAALSAAEVESIAGAARKTGRLFMEAMKPRFTPLHERVFELLDSGTLGKVTALEIHQLVQMSPERGGYIVDPVQGGVLYDMGIYCASWVEELTRGNIELRSLILRRSGAVDWYDDALLMVGGTPVQIEVSGETGYTSLCRIVCERGSIDIDLFHRPQHATVHRSGQPSKEINAPYEVDDFYGEIHHFVRCLQEGLMESPVMPLSASLRQAQILDAIRKGYPAALDRAIQEEAPMRL